MDLEYVMNLYPTVHPSFLLVAMIDIRDNGWPRNWNIIRWFEYKTMLYVVSSEERRKIRHRYKAEKRSKLYKDIDFGKRN